MNHRRLMTVAVVLVAVVALAGPPAWADLQAQETPLSQTGWAYELNLDSQGTLWVSDYGAKEIRSFDTTSGAYTAYPVGGGPSDARGDGAGSVWWADFDSNRLSRLSTATLVVTIWEIPDSSSLYSTAIDSDGDVWVSESNGPFVYKLDPDTNQLCTYALPDSGVTDYLYVNGKQLWFGDAVNARIVRLQDGTFDWWNLPAGSYPHDLELDANGRTWWTDMYKGYLGRLDSGAATITTFTPPAGGTPTMLALSGGKVWYSQQPPTSGAVLIPAQPPSSVVVLDPAAAAGETSPVTAGSQEATPECRELQPLPPSAVTATTGQASWTGQTYPTALEAAGWVIYQMPGNAVPCGISAADQVWLVDQGRRVLARLGSSAPSVRIYLPLARKG
jgi:streptogramin lyase